MANQFPEIKDKNKGKFTTWVKKNMKGKDTCSAASSVMANKDDYSTVSYTHLTLPTKA